MTTTPGTDRPDRSDNSCTNQDFQERDASFQVLQVTSPELQSQSQSPDVSTTSSWRRLLFPFASSPSPVAASAATGQEATATARDNDDPNDDYQDAAQQETMTPNSLPMTPLCNNNSNSRNNDDESPPASQTDYVFWNSAPAITDESTMADGLTTPLLQFTPSREMLPNDTDELDRMIPPPPTTALRRQRSSWSRRSRSSHRRRPSLNGLNLLNAVAFVMNAAVFVWTTIVYWRRYPGGSDDANNHHHHHHHHHHNYYLPLFTPASWYTWYATKFPLIGLQAVFAVAQLLPVYRNRSAIQSGRDGGVGVCFAQVCVLQLIACICGWYSMASSSMDIKEERRGDVPTLGIVDDNVLLQDDFDAPAPQPYDSLQSQRDWVWRAIMLLQTTANAMMLLLLAHLWMRRSSLPSSSSSGSSSVCSVLRRVVDFSVLELPFSWLLASVCVELVHLLAVLVLEWDSPWSDDLQQQQVYGAWPRAMDYMGLAWLLPVALFALLGWRPGAGTHGEREEDHVMTALLFQQHQSSGASSPAAWRPDFCVPAVILVAYVSIAMRLQELQHLAFDGDEDAAAAIKFYGGTDVAEAFVLISFVLTGTVGLVWILALVVWLSRQFCTIRVVQVSLEDDY